MNATYTYDASWDKTDYSKPLPQAGAFSSTSYGSTSGKGSSINLILFIGGALSAIITLIEILVK